MHVLHYVEFIESSVLHWCTLLDSAQIISWSDERLSWMNFSWGQRQWWPSPELSNVTQGPFWSVYNCSVLIQAGACACGTQHGDGLEVGFWEITHSASLTLSPVDWCDSCPEAGLREKRAQLYFQSQTECRKYSVSRKNHGFNSEAIFIHLVDIQKKTLSLSLRPPLVVMEVARNCFRLDFKEIHDVSTSLTAA